MMMQRKRSRQPTASTSPMVHHVHLWSMMCLMVVLRPMAVEAWASPRALAFSPSVPAAKRHEMAATELQGGSINNNQHRTTTSMMSLPSSKATSGLSSSRPDTRRNFRNTEVDDIQSVRFSPRKTASVAKQRQHRFRVYCDLDGVLVDFCTGVKQLYKDEELEEAGFHCRTTLNVDELHRGSMWQRVAHADSFFEHLPWTEAGQPLWEVVRQLRPTILTGVPVNPPSSRQQKVDWCRRNLGIPVIAHTDKAGQGFQHVATSSWEDKELELSLSPHRATENDNNNNNLDEVVCHVITCWSNNKHYESGPGAVLIDDRIELKEAWESKGGIFVHHTGCAEETVAQLYKHGIIQEFLQS